MFKIEDKKQNTTVMIKGFIFLLIAYLVFPPVAALPMNILHKKLAPTNLLIILFFVTFAFMMASGVVVTLIKILPVLLTFYCIETATKDKTKLEVIFYKYLKTMVLATVVGYVLGWQLGIINDIGSNFSAVFKIMYGDTSGKIIEILTYNFIGVIFSAYLMIFLCSYACYLASYRFLEGMDKIPYDQILNKRIPHYLIRYLFGSMALILIETEPFVQIATNLTIVFLSLYFVQGILVGLVIIARKSVINFLPNKFLRYSLLLSSILLIPYLIVGLGVADNWFDFRKIEPEKLDSNELED